MKLEQKSVKNLVGFLGDLKTPKFHSEINRPLESSEYLSRVELNKSRKDVKESPMYLEFLSQKYSISLNR